jgi:hypothetical protein
LAQALRLVGAVLQALQASGVVASLPAIECLRADAEVAAGEAGIMTMGIVIIKPF